jgi:hypothetical protein
MENQVLQIAVAAIQLQQKAYNKFGAKPKLGRRRRSSSSGPAAAAAAHWQNANPQARISLFVFLWYLPPSLPSFFLSFLPCFLLLGPGYYYFAT